MQYKKSVERLLEAAKANEEVRRRIKGTIIGMLEVEKGCEVAVETALGVKAQDIVTENIDDARWLIEYIKKTAIGTIAFYPAQNINPVISTDQIPQGNGVLGWLSEFVKCEKKYVNIILNVLQDTVLCDTVENAVEFVKKEGHKYKVVTLAGDIIERNGRLIGVGEKPEKNIDQ